MVPSKQPRAASSSPGAPVGVGSSADDGATEPTVPNVVPESSPNDPYAYRHITLENGLCALLVVEKPKSAAERARIDAAKKKAAKKQTTVGANTAPAAPAKAEEPDAEGGPDAESKPATVALAVRVGHWSDPKAVPGLAHFLEHMLFMGNKQFPSENEWEEYLSEHGGSSNAFTDADTTCYYFDVNPAFLHPALQRFAQFFVSPLFAPSAVKREIRAVDSEFRDGYNSDPERMSELMNYTASLVNPEHPFGKWGWGNIESLETNLKPKKNTDASKQQQPGKKNNTAQKGGKGKQPTSAAPVAATPTAPAVDLRAELKAFHARHYSSHAVKLVVFQASGKLDKLERWIRAEFEAIANNGLPIETFENAGHPFLPPGKTLEEVTSAASAAAASSSSSASASPAAAAAASSPSLATSSCLQRWYYTVPIKEIYKLNVSWMITPSLSRAYAKKPLHYAEHLLGHESAGSLYSLLRRKGWLTSLVAGVSESGQLKNEALECMQLSIDMTKEGSRHVEDILDITFQYLALIRRPANIQESIYHELRQLSELGFLYSESLPPEDLVQDQAINLHIYPPRDSLRGDFLHQAEFDRELTLKVLGALSVENARIDLAVPGNKDRPHLQKAPWFHTQWTSEPIAAEVLQKWQRYDRHPELIDPTLHLPNANEFIPTDFAIVQPTTTTAAVSSPTSSSTAGQDQSDYPVLVRQSSRSESWWHLDQTFKLPRAAVHILLETPAVYASPAAVALSELLIKLWVDSVNEYAYQASLAELEFSVESLRSGIELKFSGFSHKLGAFVEKIVGGLADLEAFLTDRSEGGGASRFPSMAERAARYFQHRFFVPLKQANHARLSVLQKDKWPIEQVTREAKACTIEQVIAHTRTVLQSLRIVGLVDGNIAREPAVAMFERIEKKLCGIVAAPASASSSLASRRVETSLSLPSGRLVRVSQRCRNPRESNHAIEVYFQIGPATLDLKARLGMVEALMAEPGFDQLRTQQQLGYKVQSGVRNTHGMLGFAVSIQSAAYEPDHLSSRVDSFLYQTFYALLLAMPAEKFLTQRASLVAEYLYEDTHLSERVDRAWEELTERTYCFGRPRIMARWIEQVTQEEVIAFYEHYFMGITAEPPKPRQQQQQQPSEESNIDMLDAAPTPSPSPASPTPDSAANAVSSLALIDPVAEEARRKEERKLAKKARLTQQKAQRKTDSSASSGVDGVKDPAVEAAVSKKVDAAKLLPVLHRKSLVVCIYGHASRAGGKKPRNANASAKEDRDGDADMEEESQDDEEGEDDGEEDEEEASGSDDGEDDDEGGSSDDAEGDDAAGVDLPAGVDSLWFTVDEWSVRSQEHQAKAVENASTRTVQPPTKKQKNSKAGKQTPTHEKETAATGSSAASTPVAMAPPQPIVEIRSEEALEAFKATSQFEDCTRPEPDLPPDSSASQR